MSPFVNHCVQILASVCRLLLPAAYYALSLTTSSLILFYVSLLGHSHWFCKRMRCILAVVTCAPWLLCFGVRLAIQNEEKMLPEDKTRRILHIGTHASHLDGLSMMVAYWRGRSWGMPPCAMVKREVLFTPFYGIFAYLVGNVFVARGGSRKQAAMLSMTRCADRVKQGYLLGIFPEGTRRRALSVGKEHLLAYKKGGFHLAVELAATEPVTIVPFCLIGSRSAWPVNSLLPIAGSKVTLKFLSHITPDKESAEELLEMTRKVHEKGIEKAARNTQGAYDIDQAFSEGVEINMYREFLLEAILLIIPSAAVIALGVLGLL